MATISITDGSSEYAAVRQSAAVFLALVLGLGAGLWGPQLTHWLASGPFSQSSLTLVFLALGAAGSVAQAIAMAAQSKRYTSGAGSVEQMLSAFFALAQSEQSGGFVIEVDHEASRTRRIAPLRSHTVSIQFAKPAHRGRKLEKRRSH
jgi:hypothetical protein